MSDDEWPEMASSEYDEGGFARPGSYAVSVVSIAGSKAGGQPFASIQSAGCAYCNRWAVEFYQATKLTADGIMFNSIHRRASIELIYVCDQHGGQAADELLETHGACTNALDLELAVAVEKNRRTT